MSEPLVTIVVVTYSDRHLEDVLQSAVDQTYPNIEVIMLDDAGPGRTYEICDTFATKHPHFRHVRNEVNLHYFRNYQKAFHLGNGPYFMAAADDNLLAPSLIEECVRELEADPTLGSCISEVSVIDDMGKEIEHWDVGALENCTFEQRTSFIQMLITLRKCVGFHGVLRRSMMEKLLPLDEQESLFDLIFMHNSALYRGYKTIDKTLFYRRSSESSTKRLVCQDQVRGLPYDTLLSQLGILCPTLTSIMKFLHGISQSDLPSEVKADYLKLSLELTRKRNEKILPNECLLICNFLMKHLEDIKEKGPRLSQVYFLRSAVRLLSDVIMIMPQFKEPKNVLHVYLQKLARA
jgi:glycosyltransferase involved in cell wall biosynthesis